MSTRTIMLRLGLLFAVVWLVVTACSQQPDTAVTNNNPFDVPIMDTEDLFTTEVQPILNKRCVVCHACYDSPCQLKLGAYEGLTRGANKTPVYHGDRLVADEPSRLFVDAQLPSQWREKSFFPVLNEDGVTQNNIRNSLIASMIALKNAHPGPVNAPLPDSIGLDLNRDLQCPTIDEFDDYQSDYALGGMPYGLPAIAKHEQETIFGWLAEGAKAPKPKAISEAEQNAIEKWESFFNQKSLKGRLVSRYLFEHLFIAHVYFSLDTEPRFFKVVRSTTPPGQPINIIATRRPFSDPGVDHVYYRFIPVKLTISDKLHMPILLDENRMAQWQEWFITPDYDVTSLPGYEPKVASNPFVAFAQLPVEARYRFMISESQYTIMQFIKGPVCRGRIALNVINDYFWVVFAEPNTLAVEMKSTFLQQARQQISLPAESQSNALPTNWINYAAQEREYLEAKTQYMNEHVIEQIPIDLNLIWDGDGDNDNVGLTIFRHYDAATVVKGLVGDKPQTAWIITYPLFERIHYLLVAGYDVYGNVGHQLNSRMYMDFLRMEGEFNFLSLLPSKTRNTVWKQWYRGVISPVEDYVAKGNQLRGETDLEFTTDDPLSELYSRIKQHVKPALATQHDLANGLTDDFSIKALKQVDQIKGIAASLMPQSTFVLVRDGEQSHVYTLLRNNAYSNISHIIAEDARRIPKEDTLTLAAGFASSHPNLLLVLDKSELPSMASAMAALATEEDRQQFLVTYGVRRTDPEFWEISDQIHQFYQQHEPIKFGWFDYNRLINW